MFALLQCEKDRSLRQEPIVSQIGSVVCQKRVCCRDLFEAQAGLTPHFPGEMTCLEEEQGQSDDLNSKDGLCPDEAHSDEKDPTEEKKIKAAEADEIKSFKCKEKERCSMFCPPFRSQAILYYIIYIDKYKRKQINKYYIHICIHMYIYIYICIYIYTHRPF